jgi:hypothetical protein
MTEKQWLKCHDPDEMLRGLSGKASDRKLRLFACACCRRIWRRIADQRSRRAVEISESYADGEADFTELEEAFRVADQAHMFSPERFQGWAALDAARLAAHPEMRGLADGTATAAAMEEAKAASDFWKEHARKKSQQCIILRELFGNPFCSLTIPSSALSWNDGIVLRLAQAAYDNRILAAGTLDNGRLLILADALEEAGCTDEQILTHLRKGGEHYRGCWVLDLLLGKE